MKNKIIILHTALISFGAFSVFAHNTGKQEALYGVTFFENSIEIIVKSNGCTKAQDFRLEMLNGSDHTLLNIIRTKPDRCRKMSKPMRIILPLHTNQQNHYKINNSFVINKRNRKSTTLGSDK